MTRVQLRALHTIALLSVMTILCGAAVRARVARAGGSERGAHVVEYAVIGGVVVALAVVLGVKLTTAYNTHSANIK